MASIDRYLSRSIFMVGLADMARWNASVTGTPVEQAYLTVLTKLNAQYISRAAGKWDWSSDIVAGTENTPTTFLYGAKQAVININNAYDIAKLQRPIIECAIMEHVRSEIIATPDVPATPGQGVELVPVTQDVRNRFLSDPDYILAGYNSTFPVNYTFNNIVIPGTNRPDYNKIEARMWFYHQAIIYIDLGYKGLHAGDLQGCINNDAGYLKTADLFKSVREYAEGKGQIILINADTDRDIYINGTEKLLLDFNSCPIRPDESLNHIDGNMWQDVGAGERCINNFVDVNHWAYNYKNTPCQGKYNTELNFYKYNEGLMNSHGGIAPSGCVYDRTPTLFNIDWHAIQPELYRSYHVGFAPWGFDEANWFNQLNPECQVYYLKSFIEQIKNDAFYRGYLKMPGGLCGNTCTPVPAYSIDGQQYQSFGLDLVAQNRTDLTEAIREAWEINTDLNFTVTERCVPYCESKRIDIGEHFTSMSGRKRYTLRVTNPDGSSIYTWHIQKPDGNWLPYTYGTERILEDLTPGVHRIMLRQDAVFQHPLSGDCDTGASITIHVKHILLKMTL